MSLFHRLFGPREEEIKRLEAELEVVSDFIAIQEGTFEEEHADLSDEGLAKRAKLSLNYGRAKGWMEGCKEKNS